MIAVELLFPPDMLQHKGRPLHIELPGTQHCCEHGPVVIDLRDQACTPGFAEIEFAFDLLQPGSRSAGRKNHQDIFLLYTIPGVHSDILHSSLDSTLDQVTRRGPDSAFRFHRDIRLEKPAQNQGSGQRQGAASENQP